MKTNALVICIFLFLALGLAVNGIIYLNNQPPAPPPVIRIELSIQMLNDDAKGLLSPQDMDEVNKALSRHHEHVAKGQLFLDVVNSSRIFSSSVTPVFYMVMEMHSGWQVQTKAIRSDKSILVREIIRKINRSIENYLAMKDEYRNRAATNFVVYDL